MSIFKRAEVWILLVLTVAGLVFVLLKGGTGTEEDPETDSPQKKSAGANPPERIEQSPNSEGAEFSRGGVIEVEKVEVKRDADNYFAEVFIAYDNQSKREVVAMEEAKLITASGKPRSYFFLAFEDAPPKLPPGEKTSASLLFSVPPGDLSGGLSLEIRGERVPVKSDSGFDPESIADKKSKTFKDLEW